MRTYLSTESVQPGKVRAGFRRLRVPLMAATQMASAALPSTSTGGSSFRQVEAGDDASYDLYCDFDAKDEDTVSGIASSNVQIEAYPANTDGLARKSFRLSGDVLCVEVNRDDGIANPTLARWRGPAWRVQTSAGGQAVRSSSRLLQVVRSRRFPTRVTTTAG